MRGRHGHVGLQQRCVTTEQLYLTDAYLREFDAAVTHVDDGRRVALDRSAFYPTGGGQPHDTGILVVGGRSAKVTDVRKEGPFVWHTLEVDHDLAPGDTVHAALDWPRRHALMRTHTALHILCGVIWHRWEVPVTGGNMEPLQARMDFEFDPLPESFAETVTELVNAEIVADRRIAIEFLERDAAFADDDLIRTKVNLIPAGVQVIRVVDIVGLDRQADGGTHVRTTGEVGGFEVVRTESKGKGSKRLRVRLS
jgi:misacylated tRNA(Ala) deacylase